MFVPAPPLLLSKCAFVYFGSSSNTDAGFGGVNPEPFSFINAFLFFLEKEEFIGDAQLMEIHEDKAVFSVKGESFELVR